MGNHVALNVERTIVTTRLSSAAVAAAAFGAFAANLAAIWINSKYQIPWAAALALPLTTLILWVCFRRIDLVVAGVLLTRASIDPLLTAMSPGGGAGLGALMNAVVLFAGLHALVKERWRTQARWIAIPWITFLVFTALSIRLSIDPLSSFRTWLGILSQFAMLYLGFTFSSSYRNLKHATLILLAASLLPTAMGLVNMFLGYGVPLGMGDALFDGGELTELSDSDLRIASTFPHPNIYAFFLLTTLALVLYAIRQTQDRRKKALLIGYMAVQCLLLIGTQTRSGWLAAAALFLIYAIAVQPKSLLIIIFSLVLLPFIPTVGERIFDVTSQINLSGGGDGFALNSFAWRKVLWASAQSWIEASPWVGYGLDSFPRNSLTFFPLEVPFGFAGFDAHNTFVQMAFEAGILGAIAFAAIYIVQIVYAFNGRNLRVESSLIAGLALGYLLGAMSDNMHRYLVANWYHAFLTGMLMSAIALKAPCKINHV